jgi:hypothetical protein
LAQAKTHDFTCEVAQLESRIEAADLKLREARREHDREV